MALSDFWTIGDLPAPMSRFFDGCVHADQRFVREWMRSQRPRLTLMAQAFERAGCRVVNVPSFPTNREGMA